jgi:NAD(P)H-flavin reductase/ferredoxin
MMKLHSITANGTTFSARTGDVILDAALAHGIDFPHDCRAGRCGSCLAKVTKGVTLGGEAFQRGTVHACQARVFSDLELEFEDLPPVHSIAARVTSIVPRSVDVVEVGVKLLQPLQFLPGQYCRFKFRGFPARSFSPTLPADGSLTSDDLTLHVKRVRGGLVSNALGTDIQVDHRLRVEGPFGTAFYRTSGVHRLVLVAGGTGFAPILSIAMAALAEDPKREIVVVAGARTIASLYMAPGLVQLQRFPNVRIVVTAGEVPAGIGIVRRGGPADHMPQLLRTDIVYAAGAPAMIERIAEKADLVGADFYSDPFEPAAPNVRWWGMRKTGWQAPKRMVA